MFNSQFDSENSHDLRYFTKDEANAMLPLVQVIVRDIRQLATDLVDRKSRLTAIRTGSAYRTEIYADELEQVEKTLEDDRIRLQELLEELCDLGVHPHEPLKGIVAFPTRDDESPSYLIWKFGDEHVSPMEEFDEDFDDFQQLDFLFEPSEN